MARSKDGKRPKLGAAVTGGKSVRIKTDPSNFDTETLCWQIRKADWEHPEWGWSTLDPHVWDAEIRRYLSDFESMTWAELRGATGGKASGTNHHAIPVEDLCKDAQDRLMALGLDDIDSVFSLRVTGTIRVYGHKSGRVFRILWYDRNHGDPRKAVCPSKKRHT